MREINFTCKNDYGVQAGGVLAQLEKFSTYFALKLSHLVFSATEQVSKLLQAKDTTIQQAIASSELARDYLQDQRLASNFDKFYSSTQNDALTFTGEPVLPRYKKAPRRFDNGSDPHSYQSPKDYFRQIYFEVIDLIQNEIKHRFDQNSLKVPMLVQNLLLKSANWDGKEELLVDEEIMNFYSKDLNKKQLEQELTKV